MEASTPFDTMLATYREAIVRQLEIRTKEYRDAAPAPRHAEAVAYSLLAGGKRVRPTLLLATYDMVKSASDGATPACARIPILDYAAAVEMIHTYSLIHDDLPVMDNDDLRRGRPTNHKAFNEYTAVLAGDGLLNLAYETMMRAARHETAHGLRAMTWIAEKAGGQGMIAGQQIDLDAEKDPTYPPLTAEGLRELQELKTSALIEAATVGGAILAGADPRTLLDLTAYARKLGLAFQIRDDLLDVTADAKALGKTPGKDAASGKITFVTLLGRDEAEARLRAVHGEAMNLLETLGTRGMDTRFLTRYTEALLARTH